MANTKLDLEEQELLEAYESGEFESDLDADRREYLTKAAEETFKKDKRINIRISSRDLAAVIATSVRACRFSSDLRRAAFLGYSAGCCS